MKIFKQVKTANEKRLESVLSEVEMLAKGHDIRNHKAIFYIVKIYTDYLNISQNKKLLQHDAPFNAFIDDDILFNENVYVKYNKSNILELGKISIISNVWNSDRQIDTLADIGDCENPWKEDISNHLYKLFLPLGIVAVENGKHSTNCGIIKSTGYIKLAPKKSNVEIYDISHMFEKVYFDGNKYLNKKSGKSICKTKFEYGCLFEIGRIINNYDISFFNLFT